MQVTVGDLENHSIVTYNVKDQLKDHVYRRSYEAFKLGDQARDAIVSLEQLKTRQQLWRHRFSEAFGGLPSSDSPLNARITGSRTCTGFRIENVIFESRPETYVTANLYIPDGITSPGGAVLFLCGHSEQGKQHDEYIHVCRTLVQAGLIVLAMDPIGQGERLSYYEREIGETTVPWGIHEHDHAGLQCVPLGEGPAKYFVHDAMRAVDYLNTRPEVDPSRIGVTGNSGGGTQTSMMMVCDPRIAAAVPATFIMNRQTMMETGQAQDAEQIWHGLTAQGFDHEDILLCMAPRPVLVMAATYDFFPIEGTRRTVDRARRLWELSGAGSCLAYIEDVSDHRYSRNMARAAADFFSLHLLENRAEHSAHPEVPVDPLWLQCTSNGQVRSEYAHARGVYEENAARMLQLQQMRQGKPRAESDAEAVRWLRERVDYGRKPCDFNPRLSKLGYLNGLSVHSVMWWAQEGIMNHALLFKGELGRQDQTPVTIAVWEEGTRQIGPHLQWLTETCGSGRTVMVLDTTGVGACSPHLFTPFDPREFYGTLHKLTTDLFWLNDSLAALRIYDVGRALNAVEWIAGIDPADIRLYAGGRQGLYAQLAALLTHRLAGIEVSGGMAGMGEWIQARHYDTRDIITLLLPEMLRYFDLPDVRRWLDGMDR